MGNIEHSVSLHMATGNDLGGKQGHRSLPRVPAPESSKMNIFRLWSKGATTLEVKVALRRAQRNQQAPFPAGDHNTAEF